MAPRHRIAELSWEIQRYRVLRHRLLCTARQKAIETRLRRIDVAGIAPELQEMVELYTVRNALDWQLDPTAAHDIDTRLRAYAFDQHAISMEAYVQAREMLALFETLLNGAQLRHLVLLKETTFRRSKAGVNSDPMRARLSRFAERQRPKNAMVGI